MDKRILIDGVDVTDCEYCSRYANTTIYHCEWTGECKEHPNCHYKNWKRKEEECKDLRTDIKDIANLLGLDTDDEYNFSNIEVEITQLKEERDSIKYDYQKQLEITNTLWTEKETMRELFNNTCRCKHLVLDECSLTGKNCIGIKMCMYKKHQILNEVKAIADAIVNGTHFTKDIEGHLKELAKQIIQKINE